MSPEQSLFTWSTFRDSSMSAKLKYFWKAHETVTSARSFFTKTCLTNSYLSCDPDFVILAWVQGWIIFEKLMKLWSLPEFFHKSMSHEQLLFTWSIFRDYAPKKTHALLTENLCSLQIRFSKIFQPCTHARITKCGSHER